MQIKQKWLIDKKTTVGFGLALSMLTGIGVFSYLNFLNYQKTNDQVEHTREVLEKNANILTLMTDAETGQRGYLIASEKRYLQPYYLAIDKIEPEIKELRQLTSDNPSQQRRLDILEPLVVAKLTELKETIALRQNQGLEASLQVVKTNRGKQLMDQIRKLNSEIATQENQLLQERSQQQLATAQNTTSLTIAGSILVFGLVLQTLALVNRDIIWRKQSEERYRAFIAQSSEGIWRFELQEPILIDRPAEQQIAHFYEYGYLAECNNVMAQMYGYTSAKELVGVKLRDLLIESPNNTQYLRSFIDSGYRLNAAESDEVDKHGTAKYFLNSLVGIIENGVLLRAWGTQVDITERKQLEEALRERETRYRLVARATNDAIWDWDLVTNTVEWNEGIETLFGYWTTDVGSDINWWQEHIHPDDRERIVFGIHDVIDSGGQIWTDEYRYLRADNSYALVIDRGLVAHDEQGKPVRMIGSVMDITQRHKAEAELRLSETRFRMLMDNVQDYAIFLLDTNACVVRWSAGAENILGYQEAEILGQPGSIIFTPEDLQHGADKEELNTAVNEGQAEDERWHVRKDGRYFWASGIMTALRNESGQLQGFAKIMRDFTERKQAEEEREQLLASEQAARNEAEAANRMKDEFLATLSHELRTPLNAMLGWTNLLRTRKFDEKTTTRALETIDRNTKSLAQLIEDVLDVSRIITGKLRLNMSLVELVPIIEAAIETVQPAADAKNIQINSMLQSAIGSVWGDANRLQQVFWNLLSNAVKFTPKGGRVEIKLQMVDSRVQVEISDTGQGIEPEFLPYVFERFRQADSTTTRSYGGLGLGLAIVRHLVELHGGSVRAESLGVGQGATFIVSLPLKAVRLDTRKLEQNQEAVIEEVPEINNGRSLDGLRVLVVDDEPDARELLTTVLEEYGAQVIAVASAAEALEAIKQLQPDVLVSDIGMPQEDGYTLIRKVRALTVHQGGQIPAVALTAYARAEDRAQALLAGFQQHISKPVDPAQLALVVASLAGRNESN